MAQYVQSDVNFPHRPGVRFAFHSWLRSSTATAVNSGCHAKVPTAEKRSNGVSKRKLCLEGLGHICSWVHARELNACA